MILVVNTSSPFYAERWLHEELVYFAIKYLLLTEWPARLLNF